MTSKIVMAWGRLWYGAEGSYCWSSGSEPLAVAAGEGVVAAKASLCVGDDGGPDGNVAPIYSDVQFCASLGRDRVLVCGLVTLHIVLGASGRSTSGLTTANLALDELRLEHPVFVGDTLYAQTEITGARPSRSRPDNGIVTCKISGFNQDGRRVIVFQRTFLVRTDASTLRDTTHY